MSALSKFMTKKATAGVLIAALATPALAADGDAISYRHIEGQRNGVITGIVNSSGRIKIRAPSKGISGWICAVNYFQKDSGVTASQASRAARRTLSDYTRINNKWVRRNAGRSNPSYSGRAREEFGTMSRTLHAIFPNDLSQTMYRGNNPGKNATGRLKLSACYSFAAQNANGRPYSVYGLGGSQHGQVTPNHHKRGVYTRSPVGTPKPFDIQGFRFVR